MDLVHPNHDLKIRKIKDISAAAVLIVCIATAIIGLLILLPPLLKFLF